MNHPRLSVPFAALSLSAAAHAQLSGGGFLDLDGDGVVSDLEIGAQVRDDLVKIVRKNSDGFLVTDRNKIVDDMIVYLKSVSGDFDGDGVVTLSDMVAQVASAGTVDPRVPSALQGDLNGDGVVDGADLLMTSNNLGVSTELADDESADLWAELLDAAREHSADPSALDIFGVPRGDPHRGPGSHNQTITASWPPPPPGPMPTNPEWDWPPDHWGSASATWGDESHPSWPADHHRSASITWGISDPDNHDSVVSAADNPMDPDEPVPSSSGWPAGHNRQVSITWHTSPVHNPLLSEMWPAGHQLINSNSGLLGENDHIQFISASWVDHHQTVSESWPANHWLEVSGSWLGHDLALSAKWPPQHVKIYSTAWGDDPPGHWPANHYVDVSADWDSPDPGDHTLTATIIQDNPTLFPFQNVTQTQTNKILHLWLSGLR